jgi:hypothetical protein
MQIEFSDELLALNPPAPPEDADQDGYGELATLLNPKRETPAEPPEVAVMGVDERLKLAFPQGVPRDVMKFFRWDFLTADTKPGIIGGNIQKAAESAKQGIQAAQDRLATSESRLADLKRQAEQAKDGLENPSLDFSPVEVGRNALIQLGCSKLIPLAEHDVERSRRELARAERAASNWAALAELAEVITGFKQPSDSLAKQLAFEFAWELAPEHVRAAEKAAREKAAAAKAAASVEFGKEWDAQHKSIAENVQHEAAEIARVEEMNFSCLVKYLGGPYSDALKSLTADPRNSHLIAMVRPDFERPYAEPARERARQRLLQMIRAGEAAPIEEWSNV